MKTFSFTVLVQSTTLVLFLIGSSVASSDESTQRLHSVSMTSEDVASAHDATTVPDVPRELKKAKGTAKDPKSGKKVSKSSKALTDQCASIITQKDALLALKAGFANGYVELSNWVSTTEPCTEDTSNWSKISCNSDGKVTEIDLRKCNMFWISILFKCCTMHCKKEMNEISSFDTLHTDNIYLTGTISPLIGCPTTLVSTLTVLDFCKYISNSYTFLLIHNATQDMMCSLTI